MLSVSTDVANTAAIRPEALSSAKDLLVANHDVMVLIFNHFSPTSSNAQGRESQLTVGGQKQLLDLARSCKAFRDPALACLWSHLESLTPLFELHPGLHILEQQCFFRGDIKSRGSEKFYEYARRVRTIRFVNGANNRTKTLSLAGYTWLGQQLRGSSLLPGLKSIRFDTMGITSEHLGLLPLLLSPDIERVEFRGAFLFSTLFQSHALPLVCESIPSMKHLELHDEDSSSLPNIWGSLPVMGANLQSLAMQFPNNHTLEPNLLRRLCVKFRHLTSLTLDVHTPSHAPSEEVLGRITLPALTHLHLINRSETKLCKCYPLFLLHKATAVTFHLSASAIDGGAFSNALETLSTMPSVSRIKIVGANDGVIASTAAILPILEGLELEEFLLRTWGFTELAVGEQGQVQIQTILDAVNARAGTPIVGCAKPLRVLELPLWRNHFRAQQYYDNYYGYHRSYQDILNYPPMKCLLYIAQHAKSLHRISLSINSYVQLGSADETVKSMIQTWEEPKTPSELRYLEIVDMRPASTPFTPSEYGDIARLLDAIFPNLVSVSVVEDTQRNAQWDETWKVIEENRQLYKSLRLYRSNRW